MRARTSQAAGWRLSAILGVVLVGLVACAAQGEGQPAATATTPRPTGSPTPREAAAAPSPTPTEQVSETVLFAGGPAHGPWQMIGAVAEITHPEAPPSAGYSYTTYWADLYEENQPDWLWNQLAAEVAEQAVQLGEPVDRPAFGGAPGSEPFNAGGGIEDIYFQDRAFSAMWRVVFEDSAGVAAAHWAFLVDFGSEIIAREGPLIIRESEVADFNERSQRAVAWLREFANQEGYR